MRLVAVAIVFIFISSAYAQEGSGPRILGQNLMQKSIPEENQEMTQEGALAEDPLELQQAPEEQTAPETVKVVANQEMQPEIKDQVRAAAAAFQQEACLTMRDWDSVTLSFEVEHGADIDAKIQVGGTFTPDKVCDN